MRRANHVSFFFSESMRRPLKDVVNALHDQFYSNLRESKNTNFCVSFCRAGHHLQPITLINIFNVLVKSFFSFTAVNCKSLSTSFDVDPCSTFSVCRICCMHFKIKRT